MPPPITIAERIPSPQERVKKTLDGFWGVRQAVGLFARWGVSPFLFTALGLIGYLVMGVLFGLGYYKWAIGLGCLASWFDILDGSLARAEGRVSRFGGFLDSVFDRFAEGAVFAGIAFWYFSIQKTAWAVMTLVAWIFAFQVSYTRARAENEGIPCEVGYFTRAFRIYTIGILGLLDFLHWAMALVLLGSFITTLQRIWHTYRDLSKTHR